MDGKRALRPAVAAVLLALALGLLAACGGEEGSADGSGGEQASFVEQADAICVDASESFVEATREPVTSSEEGAELDQETIELREAASERLAELDPPADLESDYDAFLAADRELTELNRQLAEAFADGDQRQADRLLEALNRTEDEVESLAADTGLTACAGELPEEELVEVGSTAREFFTSTDPVLCREVVTDKFVEEVYGGTVEDCEREIEQREPPAEVTTSDASGTGPSASVEAQLPGGETVDVFLVQEDGAWKVDVANPAPE
jgi:hypothetical protein